eukprot:TRINITY_DN5453_c0_g1_i1.p1 TRINITY_DN5453_c0_g1~~TRINITY_DN5453_c0_g1_i1.p1  ORF type:complete len:296 (-),score=37.88 TRINITY_DN5453_c0_g1_i1:34-921(-)
MCIRDSSGVIVAGFGFSSFLFSLLAERVINPDGIAPMIKGEDGNKYFTADVANNVPLLMIINAIIFVVLGIAGSLMMFTRDYMSVVKHSLLQMDSNVSLDLQRIDFNTNEETEEILECPDLARGLKSPAFWIMMLTMLFASSYGFHVIANFKSYGLANGLSDYFLTWVGAVSAFMNGITQPFWAFFQDKIGFKRVFFSILLLQAFTAKTITYVVDTDWLYFIWCVISYVCIGGYFAIFPALSTRVFGVKIGSKIYGFLFFAFSFGNLLQFTLNRFLSTHISDCLLYTSPSPRDQA